MPKPVRAFSCEHGCARKVDTSKLRMAKHEAICFHNPVRRACQTCAHLGRDSNTIYNPYHGGDPGSTDYEQEFSYCEVREDVDLTKRLVCDCPSWCLTPHLKSSTVEG